MKVKIKTENSYNYQFADYCHSEQLRNFVKEKYSQIREKLGSEGTRPDYMIQEGPLMTAAEADVDEAGKTALANVSLIEDRARDRIVKWRTDLTELGMAHRNYDGLREEKSDFLKGKKTAETRKYARGIGLSFLMTLILMAFDAIQAYKVFETVFNVEWYTNVAFALTFAYLADFSMYTLGARKREYKDGFISPRDCQFSSACCLAGFLAAFLPFAYTVFTNAEQITNLTGTTSTLNAGTGSGTGMAALYGTPLIIVFMVFGTSVLSFFSAYKDHRTDELVTGRMERAEKKQLKKIMAGYQHLLESDPYENAIILTGKEKEKVRLHVCDTVNIYRQAAFVLTEEYEKEHIGNHEKYGRIIEEGSKKLNGHAIPVYEYLDDIREKYRDEKSRAADELQNIIKNILKEEEEA